MIFLFEYFKRIFDCMLFLLFLLRVESLYKRKWIVLMTSFTILLIPDTSSLVTTAVSNTKISEVENKIADNSIYITTQKLNKLTVQNLSARLKQADLVKKTDFDNKLTSFNRRIASNKPKYLEVQNKLNSLITKDFF